MVKLAYMHEVGVLSLLSLRMLFALPFYLITALVLYRKDPQKLTRKQIIGIIASGLAGYYLASFMDFMGLKYITASLERLVLFIYPSIVVVLSAILYRKAITRAQFVALAFTYVGIFVAFYQEVVISLDPQLLIGATWVFGSAFTFACYLIGSGDFIPQVGAARFTAYAMMVSCTGILTHTALSGEGQLLGLAPPIYGYGLAIAFFSTVIPSFLMSRGIGLIGASNASIIGSIGPISTIILAWYFLGERITASQWVGTGLVLTGVLMISLQKARRAQSSSD